MNGLEILKTIWPIIVLQLLFQLYALYDLAKKKKVKNLNIPFWIVIIIFGEIIGAALYFLLGRSEE